MLCFSFRIVLHRYGRAGALRLLVAIRTGSRDLARAEKFFGGEGFAMRQSRAFIFVVAGCGQWIILDQAGSEEGRAGIGHQSFGLRVPA